MGDAVDKVYHTPIKSFLYNVLFPTKLSYLCEFLGPLTACLAYLLQ